MPSTKLAQFSGEVTALVPQPGMDAIERRARHRRAKRWSALAVAGTVGVGLSLALLAGVLPEAANQAAAPTGSGGKIPAGPIIWVGAGDAQHLYAIVDLQDGKQHLLASEDGGGTWTVRDGITLSNATEPEVRGPQTLDNPIWPTPSSASPAEPSSASVQQTGIVRHQVSTDGGRTWADLVDNGTPAATVPAGGWLTSDCAMNPMSSPNPSTSNGCRLIVVDPAIRQTHPLAHQPAITITDVVLLPTRLGLWVSGYNAADKPTLAVSHDGGATWSTHVFDDLAPPTRSGIADRVAVSTRDGQVVDVVGSISETSRSTTGANKTTNSEVYGFRSTDGGQTWQPLNNGTALPTDKVTGRSLAWVAPLTLPDGTLVVQLQSDNATFGRLTSRDGVTWTAGSGNWPAGVVHVASDGSFYATDHKAIFCSTDGKTWRSIDPTS